MYSINDVWYILSVQFSAVNLISHPTASVLPNIGTLYCTGSFDGS